MGQVAGGHEKSRQPGFPGRKSTEMVGDVGNSEGGKGRAKPRVPDPPVHGKAGENLEQAETNEKEDRAPDQRKLYDRTVLYKHDADQEGRCHPQQRKNNPDRGRVIGIDIRQETPDHAENEQHLDLIGLGPLQTIHGQSKGCARGCATIEMSGKTRHLMSEQCPQHAVLHRREQPLQRSLADRIGDLVDVGIDTRFH